MAGLKQNQRDAVIFILKGLDMKGLREVHELLKTAVDLLQRKTKLEFRRGDIVQWPDRGGKIHTGSVEKPLRKRVRVIETDGAGHLIATWKVSPHSAQGNFKEALDVKAKHTQTRRTPEVKDRVRRLRRV